MQSAKRRANVKWFSDKPKRRGRSTPQQIVALRLADFARLFRSRYGITLPNNDAGRADMVPVIHHIAALKQAAAKARRWLELWAPWLTLAEQQQIIQTGIAGARAWRADQLAWRYHISREERTMLGLTTIGAVDHAKAARTKRRRERDRVRKERQRRQGGAIPRDQYEATATNRPWELEGISRATWYRRRGHTRLNENETSPATA